MEFAKIVALATLAAIAYGVVHDQITARICIEYFTIGHPPVFRTTSPTLLALGWGVIATWWVGLPLGVALAFAARAGVNPKRAARSLLRPAAVLLGAMAICAGGFGIAGAWLAQHGYTTLSEPLCSILPQSRQIRFIIDAWAHAASYLSGIFGATVLTLQTWFSRTENRHARAG